MNVALFTEPKTQHFVLSARALVNKLEALMAVKSSKNQSDNSLKRDANKRTVPLLEERTLKELERRLYMASGFHLKLEQKRQTELNKLVNMASVHTQEVDSLMDQIRKLDGRIGLNYRVRFKSQLLALREYLDTECVPINLQKSKGRPSPQGDLALVLYSALQKARGNRPLLDKIGRLIQAQGPLKSSLDKRYGVGSFDSMNFPSVDMQSGRWERSSKQRLRNAAKEYAKIKLRKVDEDFLKEVLKGGTTEYERTSR